MLISELILRGSKTLKEKNILTHQLDSELILSKLLSKSRESLLILDDANISKKKISQFTNFINRRSKNEPIAYILQHKDFWNDHFIVDSNTLIPRPETELLVEQIVKIYKNKSLNILDIGTGSGCIIISLLQELRTSKGIAIDISKKALEIAKKNSIKFKLNNRIKFINKSITSHIPYKFDLIVSNPPYIPSSQLKNLSKDVKKYEPNIALDGGKDGLDVIKKVIYKANDILKFKGMLAIEIGYGQYKKVSQILKKNYFKENVLIKDYRNNIRCILANLERRN